MASTTYSTFDPAPAETRKLNRAITWSIVAHVGVLAFVLFTPRSWWSNTPEQKTVMTISLGGRRGPPPPGQTSVGGRTVEEVAPPPRRPNRPTDTADSPGSNCSAPGADAAAPRTATPNRQTGRHLRRQRRSRSRRRQPQPAGHRSLAGGGPRQYRSRHRCIGTRCGTGIGRTAEWRRNRSRQLLLPGISRLDDVCHRRPME